MRAGLVRVYGQVAGMRGNERNVHGGRCRTCAQRLQTLRTHVPRRVECGRACQRRPDALATRVHPTRLTLGHTRGMYAATSVERAQNASKRCEYTSVSVDHYAPPAILGCMSISSFLSVRKKEDDVEERGEWWQIPLADVDASVGRSFVLHDVQATHVGVIDSRGLTQNGRHHSQHWQMCRRSVRACAGEVSGDGS